VSVQVGIFTLMVRDAVSRTELDGFHDRDGHG
jgi:hypothetical protein